MWDGEIESRTFERCARNESPPQWVIELTYLLGVGLRVVLTAGKRGQGSVEGQRVRKAQLCVSFRIVSHRLSIPSDTLCSSSTSKLPTDSSRPPMPSRQSTDEPDTKAMGSIADRMKALKGGGMEVGPSNLSKAGHHDAPPSSHKAITMGGTSVTGGAGSFGPARKVEGPRPRTGSAQQADSHKARPVVPPKPQALRQHVPNSHGGPVTPTTPSSRHDSTASPPTRPHRSATSPPPLSSPSNPPDKLHASHSGPTSSIHSSSPSTNRLNAVSGPSSPRSVGLSPLTSPSKSARLLPQTSGLGAPPERESDLGDFEKAFPSLSEFGKQFAADDDPPPPIMGTIFEVDNEADSRAQAGASKSPNVPTKPLGPRELKKAPSRDGSGDSADLSFPSVPAFPDIPSHRPNGLPPPPANAKTLKGPEGEPPRAFRPPSPDMGADLKRSASTPNVATLMDDDAETFPVAPSEVSKPLPPPMPPSLRTSAQPNGDEPPLRAEPSPSNGPPPAAPTEPSRSVPPPVQFEKPKFPLSNSIEPDTIRTYLLNPAVDVLVLDVRPEEECQSGHVGQEYEERGAKVTVVWIDPTVLLRDG